MKNVAFVKMRDSVSFCKQILIEYVLREKQMKGAAFYILYGWSVRFIPVSAGKSHVLHTEDSFYPTLGSS